jgi:hypothetical protein
LVIVGMAGVILAAAANVVTTGRGDEGTIP